MKNHLLFLMLFSISAFSFSQENTLKIKKLKLNSAELNLGYSEEHYSKLNLEAMYDFSNNPTLLERDLSAFELSPIRKSQGRRIGINASFTPFNAATDSYNSNREIRFGAYFSAIEPMIFYYLDEGNGANKSFIYSNYVREVSVTGAYLFRKSPPNLKWFNFYAGFGLSLGSSFKNELAVIEFETTGGPTSTTSSESEFYAAKSSFFSRLYAPVGMDVTLFEHFRFGVEGTIGAGMQSVYNGKSYAMPLSLGVSTKLAYVF